MDAEFEDNAELKTPLSFFGDVMATEDFTTYTEVDPNSHITIASSTHIDADLYNNEDARVYDDKGSNHFDEFEHLVDVYWDAVSEASKYMAGVVWMLSNYLYDEKTHDDFSIDYLDVNFFQTTAGVKYLSLAARSGATKNSQNYECLLDTWYYLRIKRVGSTLTCRIWTDSGDRDNNDTGAGSYKGELSVTCPTTQFQYIYACNTRDVGNVRWITVDVENFDLQEGVIIKQVTDVLNLSDAVLNNKSLIVQDSLGLADVGLKNWNPTVTDQISLVDQALRNKQFDIIDQLSLTDSALIDKTLLIADSVTLGELIDVITEIVKEVTDSMALSDQVLINKTLLLPDQIELSDNVYVNKIIIVSDQTTLVEVVEKAVAGVVKTKIFLIMGNIAIQLTGD